MVDESKLRDLLDGKVSPDEIDDPNLISLIERIYGTEALEKLGLRQAESEPRMFSEPTPEKPASDDPLVDDQLPLASSEKWGPRWLPLLLNPHHRTARWQRLRRIRAMVGLCDADPAVRPTRLRTPQTSPQRTAGATRAP